MSPKKQRKVSKLASRPKEAALKAPAKQPAKAVEQKQQPEAVAVEPVKMSAAAAADGRKSRTLKITPARQGGHCVLLSHLPSGMREPQLRRFLGQFGRVLRVRVPRSVKTGNAKGVAFAELADPAAASAAAETLDNYLMFTRLVRCKVVQNPKRLTFATDGRLKRRTAAAAAAASAPASASASRKRSRRLRAKIERVKLLDPEFEFA